MTILNETGYYVFNEFNATFGVVDSISLFGVFLFFVVMAFLATRNASLELYALIAAGLIFLEVYTGMLPAYVLGVVALIFGVAVAYGLNRLLNR